MCANHDTALFLVMYFDELDSVEVADHVEEVTSSSVPDQDQEPMQDDTSEMKALREEIASKDEMIQRLLEQSKTAQENR